MYNKVFMQNQKCLLKILETVQLFRKQMFFQGSKNLELVIKGLGETTDFIMSNESSEFKQEEWLSILECVVSAQQNKDYIMLADVLESDLLPFLQKVQMYLQADDSIIINEYWKENIHLIKQVNLGLYDAILRDCEELENRDSHLQYEPMLAINGQPTLKVKFVNNEFCMHSTVNPEWEAKLLAERWTDSQKNEYQIYGMGMGYHVKALLDADDRNRVSVLENQIEPLMLALTYLDWQQYLLDGRLEIVYEPDLPKLMRNLKTDDTEQIFFLHYPSLQCVGQREIKEALEDYFITVSSMQEQGASLRKNFEYLQKQQLPECGELQSLFEGKKVVIVAGGPSVDDELENLKKFRADITILAVGTVARKLISNEIYPDAIIITDPQDVMYRQIEGLEVGKIPMMLLSTASRTIVEHYNGPIYLVYQYGFEPAEKVARKNGYRLFRTGGSVTTTALDVSIGLGAETIILVGADMAYTDNHSHAGGIGREIKDVSGLRQVPAVGGGMVYTSKNLDTYRKWIERRISGLRHPVVYNTSRGAKIAGAIEKPLVDVVKV